MKIIVTTRAAIPSGIDLKSRYIVISIPTPMSRQPG